MKNQIIFAGSEYDVLDRFYKSAKKFNANIIIRICADCPFVDPEIIDKLINILISKKLDYVSNTIKPTFPDGFDVEVFKFEALEKAWKQSKSKYDREHVTPFLLRNKKIKKYNYEYNRNLSNLRLTIDEKIDLEQLNTIYYNLNNKKNFGIGDIDNLYKLNKNMFSKNISLKRNEGANLSNSQKFGKEQKILSREGICFFQKGQKCLLLINGQLITQKQKVVMYGT